MLFSERIKWFAEEGISLKTCGGGRILVYTKGEEIRWRWTFGERLHSKLIYRFIWYIKRDVVCFFLYHLTLLNRFNWSFARCWSIYPGVPGVTYAYCRFDLFFNVWRSNPFWRHNQNLWYMFTWQFSLDSVLHFYFHNL